MYGPLIKYGLIVLAFIAFCVGLIAYGEHRTQLEWNAHSGAVCYGLEYAMNAGID